MSNNNLSNQQFLSGKTFFVVTFGCQMNKSDSELVVGMLDALGGANAASAATADIVIFMTCCVREAADVRLLGQVASLKNSGAIIAVGGCIGQRDGAKLVEQLPHINIVFGTHNIAHLPQLLLEAMDSGRSQVEVIDPDKMDVNGSLGTDHALSDPALPPGSPRTDPELRSKLLVPPLDTSFPIKREQSWHAWLPIMTGCNNFCTYCVVPYVRGRERSRPFEELIQEAKQLVSKGVREITLLGQNVNSYGRDLYGEARFAAVLREIGNTGIERLRFATSHPKDLSPETITAFAEVDAVMPALHLPVQSGSDAVLKAMNRNYTAAHYLDLITKVRCASKAAGKADVAFSTDIIVGFPGETQEDFDATLELVKQVGYSQAFTFIYSKREGTPAAKLVDDTPHQVIQERFEQLVEVVQAGAWQFNQGELSKTLPVLFEGLSKRDANILAGRSPGNQTVHVRLPEQSELPELPDFTEPPEGNGAERFTGQILPVKITEAKTWYLNGEFT